MKIDLSGMQPWKPDPLLPQRPAIFEEGKDGEPVAKFDMTNGYAGLKVISSDYVPVNTIVAADDVSWSTAGDITVKAVFILNTGQVFKMVDGKLVEIKDDEEEEE